MYDVLACVLKFHRTGHRTNPTKIIDSPVLPHTKLGSHNTEPLTLLTTKNE